MIKNLMDKISNKKIIISVVIILVILELLLIYLAVVSYNNKNLNKYIFGNKDLKNTSLFAVMVEDSKGDYKEQSTFPDFPYQFNITKSSCIDREGNTIKDSMLFDEENREVVLKVNKSTGCYLFFDKPKESFATSLINSGELWSSGLEGDGYRYVGTGATCSYDNGNYTIITTPSCPTLYNYTRTTISSGATTDYTYQTSCPSDTSTYTYSCTELTGTLVDSSNVPNNFICFGTSDKTECKDNEAKYMYRIIGIFEDSDGAQHLKLISFKQLSSTYKWNSSYRTDTDWADSDIYAGLNGEYFLTNTTYDYLQNATWLNKIEDWTWSAVNTLTSESSGPDYRNSSSPSEIYLHEMNRSSKTSTIGKWSTPIAKIGLMYASDYTLSLGRSALSTTSSTYTNRSTLLTGWMSPKNNGITVSYPEWTLSRSGADGNIYHVWYIHAAGYMDDGDVDFMNGVRPVFYLTSDVEKLSGKGNYNVPYLIKETNENKLKVLTSLNHSTMTVNITKGDYDLNKYCINNSPSITGCAWNKVTSETITTEVEEGRTYIHVIDKGGYLVHDSIFYEKTFSEKLIASGELWSSGLEGDGYRYTGSGAYDSATTPSNFICFGTPDATECKNNEAKYMYRIIGVFEGSDGEQHLKVIKFKQLGARYGWNTDNGADTNWLDSSLYAKLNGTSFLTNTTYNYMQNSTWLNKIYDWTWSAVNTLTNENSGPDYESGVNTQQIYLHEMNRSSKSSTIGEWKTPTAKIGLMYASDYQMCLGGSALSYIGSSMASTLRTGWMHQNNNDTTEDYYEWTMARYGAGSGFFKAWQVTSGGYISNDYTDDVIGVRPVFYLTSNVTYKSGTGTYSDPYIIN